MSAYGDQTSFEELRNSIKSWSPKENRFWIEWEFEKDFVQIQLKEKETRNSGQESKKFWSRIEEKRGERKQELKLG